MLYSKLFGKTIKSAKEFDSANASLLIKGGFIDQTMAGVYAFLPLGLRVLDKIETIVREEMDKAGSELYMASLAPLSLWETTGRLNKVDVLFKAVPANKHSKDHNDSEYVLNCTHEDVITPIAKKFNISYKDLPFAVYQIQTKFRNEARPKSGLLRGREFRMKDMYSFHKSEEERKGFYEEIKKNYLAVYERTGLGHLTYIAVASGGDFTKDYSHEFQVRCDAGEDLLFYVPSKNFAYNKEVAPSKSPTENQAEDKKLMEKIHTPGIVTVEAVTQKLNVKPTKLIKTLIYKDREDNFFAAAVRGDYSINIIKLEKALDKSGLELASSQDVEKITGAKVGFAGLTNLNKDIPVIFDDTLEGAVNMVMGANQTDYHYINANFVTDINAPERYFDIKEAKAGDLHPETSEEYEVFKASEVGNIFPLGTKYTKDFDYTYSDENGEKQPVFMGSYGIGTTRLMGVIAEVFHDERGLIWPTAVAPFTVHLVGFNLDDEKTKERAYSLYKTLEQNGIEVLFDDREKISNGEKLADADLIGCPYRAIISAKTPENQVEVKKRTQAEGETTNVYDLIKMALPQQLPL
jgi:prolyl-tRNA synthetase